MSVTTVMDRLAEICEDITGIAEGGVYAGRPDDVPPAHLPAIVILSGEASYDYDTDGMDGIVIETRTYRLLLLGQLWTLDGDLEAEKTCRPFFPLIQDAFLGRYSLGYPSRNESPLVGVQDVRLLGDGGVINIVLAGEAYSGMEFRMQVTEQLAVSYTGA